MGLWITGHNNNSRAQFHKARKHNNCLARVKFGTWSSGHRSSIKDYPRDNLRLFFVPKIPSKWCTVHAVTVMSPLNTCLLKVNRIISKQFGRCKLDSASSRCVGKMGVVMSSRGRRWYQNGTKWIVYTVIILCQRIQKKNMKTCRFSIRCKKKNIKKQPMGIAYKLHLLIPQKRRLSINVSTKPSVVWMTK